MRRTVCFALITTGILVAVGASHQWAHERRGDGSQDVSIEILDPPANTPRGVLVISANGHVPSAQLDLDLTWHVEIRTGDLSETIAENEYPAKIHVKEGSTARPKFRERLLVDPGQYDVLVSLLDERPTQNADGSVTPHSTVCGTSKTFTVR